MKLLLSRLVQFAVLLLVWAVAALHWYQPNVQPVAFPAPKPVSGAAAIYNQAFAAMPQLSEEEEAFYKMFLKTKRGEPLDMDSAKQLLAKYDASLQMLAKGAAKPQCEWGLDMSLGPILPVPHLVKGLKLSQVLGMRARLRLMTGDTAGATDDLLLIFRFARHLGEPALIIGNLVKISCDAIAINVAVTFLQDFDPTSLQRLSEETVKLPPSHSMQEAVALDGKTFAVYLRDLLATENRKRAQESLFDSSKDKPSLPSDSIDGSLLRIRRLSPMLYLFIIHKFEQRSKELEKLMGMPYAASRPKIDSFLKELKKNWWYDILSSLVLPTSASTRLKEVQIEAEWAILRTALDAQRHNPSELRARLAALRDPFDNGPIEMRDVEGGVELKLKSEEGKKSPTLIVGLPKK